MSVPATPALCRQIAFFALGPLLCFSLKDLPPLEGMNPDGMVCLAGCAWLMLWWMTEVLPLPVTPCSKNTSCSRASIFARIVRNARSCSSFKINLASLSRTRFSPPSGIRL